MKKFFFACVLFSTIYLITGCIKDKQEEFKEIKLFNEASPVAISFANKNTGFICSNIEIEEGTCLVAKTVDGGETWETTPVFLGTEKIPVSLFTDIYAISADTVYATYKSGYAKGSRGVCISADGGTSWEILIKFPYVESYNTIEYLANRSSLVNTPYSVYKTVNNWNTMNVVYENQLISGMIFSGETGFLFGYDYSSFPYIAKSTDGGDSWKTHIYSNVYDRITSVAFRDNNNGYLTTLNNDIFGTTNGANTWHLLKNLNGVGSSYYALCINDCYIYFGTGPWIFKTGDNFKVYVKVYTTSDLNLTLHTAAQPSKDRIIFLSNSNFIVLVNINN